MKDACSDEGFSSSGHTVYILYTPPHPPQFIIHSLHTGTEALVVQESGRALICMYAFFPTGSDWLRKWERSELCIISLGASGLTV